MLRRPKRSKNGAVAPKEKEETRTLEKSQRMPWFNTSLSSRYFRFIILDFVIINCKFVTQFWIKHFDN
jgi:hypothetical protein